MQDSLSLDVLMDMLLFEDLETANAKLAPYHLVADWVTGSRTEVEVRTTFGTYVCRVGNNGDRDNLTVADHKRLGDAMHAAEAQLTNAQEDSDREAYAEIPRYQSKFGGAVKEGETDVDAQQLEERFRFMLRNPKSTLVKLLAFYAKGIADTSGDIGVPQAPKAEEKPYKPSYSPMFVGGELVDVIDSLRARYDRTEVQSTSDERTVNNTVRHAYRVLNDDEKANMQHVKDMGLEFIELLDALESSREISIAKTKIEEAVMWAVRGITS